MPKCPAPASAGQVGRGPGHLSLLLVVVGLALFGCFARAQSSSSVEAGASRTPAVQAAIDESLAAPEHQERAHQVMDGSSLWGLLGIPGGPAPNLLVAFLWAVWVGWIFSTVGAFGGIMAAVGHITILGWGDFARAFGAGSPLNRLITDSIRVSNQWLGGTSALISTAGYLRLGRVVWPLGLSLAIGSVAGAFLVPRLSAGRVDLRDYLGFFGLFVLLLGALLLYQTTARGRKSSSAARAATDAFEAQPEGEARGVEVVEASLPVMVGALALVLAGALLGNLGGQNVPGAIAYALVGLGLALALLAPRRRVRFTFRGVEFSYRAWVPVLGGFAIAALASFLGVGGGFLLVPFLTSVTGLPMFLVAGTSALAVLVSMVVSIFTYMVGQGVVVAWTVVGVELLGVVVGALIGPRTQRLIPELWLKRLFVVLAFYVGVRYLSRGFFGASWLPPF